MRCPIALACLLLIIPESAPTVRAQPPVATAEVKSLDDLLARFARLQGMSARYREEKRIALLKRPLQSEGSIQFAAPDLLLRTVDKPEPATMLLAGDVLRIADASGTRRIDLQANPTVRQFVLTFVHVLGGDRSALERLYALEFAPVDSGWRLELTPRQPDLAKLIRRATVTGKSAVVEQMTLEEQSGDLTVLHFSDVNLGARFDAAARARIFRLPER